MPRWPSLVSGVASFVALGSATWLASAQTDGAPAEPSPTPPAGEPTPPVPSSPPEAPAPSTEPSLPTAPAPAEPPPASGVFPASPESPPSAAPPSPAPPAALPPADAPRAARPAPSQPTPTPRRATEGLFEEKHPRGAGPEIRHHEHEKATTDHFKIGPVVGAGVPALLSIGGTLKLTRFLGAGINVGLIPKVQLSYYGDATLSYQHYDIYGRLYPFGGGLFLGAGAGYATVDGTLKKTFDLAAYGLDGQVAYESRGSVRTLMLTALIGYFYTFDSGFSLGVDAGAQIPIAPSQVELESDVRGDIPSMAADIVRDRYITPTDRSVRDSLEKIGRTTIPTLNFRMGWVL